MKASRCLQSLFRERRNSAYFESLVFDNVSFIKNLTLRYKIIPQLVQCFQRVLQAQEHCFEH